MGTSLGISLVARCRALPLNNCVRLILSGGADLPSDGLFAAPQFLQSGRNRCESNGPDVGGRPRLIPVQTVSQKLVLCIDDDAAILSYEQILLEKSGYSVITTASAQQGLGLVTRCQFDAVLLDYELPGMNGCDVAFEIKRARPELVVILLSGCDVPIYARAVVDGFVPKLDASRELLPMIAALCGGIRHPQQRQDGVQP